jgi:HAE1 family hydrophobic/amphiphilic exporter-1
MNLPELCIRRPVMTTLLMAAFLIFGLIGYRASAGFRTADVDFPTISVTANLPGASPETMAAAVATPLEGQFSTIAGLDSMTSTSAQGSTSITLQFSLDRNIDAAAQDVQSAISAALRKLPPNMPAPPSFRKVNPADSPVFYIAMLVTDAAAVAGERIRRNPARAASVDDPRRRPGADLRIAEIRRARAGQPRPARQPGNRHRRIAAGAGPEQRQPTDRPARRQPPDLCHQGWRTAFQCRGLPAADRCLAQRRAGAARRSRHPDRQRREQRIASWNVDKRAIVLAIQRQPGANTIETVDAIKRMLPSFQSKLPAAIEMRVLFDRSVSIRDAIDDVQFTLILAGFLVILVILLFLRNLSATIIPALALPISVVGTFGAMYVLGYSLDNLSLLALTLSVGFVVDDAIVMLENIVRHVEKGETPFEAAIKGAREIGFTIISMTLSLIAVFIPGALHERHRRPPAARIRGHHLRRHPGLRLRLADPDADALQPLHPARRAGYAWPLFQLFERFFAALLAGYERTLKLAMAHPRSVLVAFFATLLLTGYLFTVVPKDFLPSGDSGQIIAFTEGAQDISFASMVKHQRALAEIVAQEPDIRSFMSAVGAGGIRPTANTGTIFMILKPRARTSLVARRDHSAPAPQTRGSPGNQGVHAESASHPHRRPAHRRAVSVHPAGHRPRRAVPMDRHADRTKSASCPDSSMSPTTSTTSARCWRSTSTATSWRRSASVIGRWKMPCRAHSARARCRRSTVRPISTR